MNMGEIKDLEKLANEYADSHGFRVPYDGTNKFYDDLDVKYSKEGFIAGWRAKEAATDSVLRNKFSEVIASNDRLIEQLKEEGNKDADGWKDAVKLVNELVKLKPYHINPYNLGDMGRIGEIINALDKLFKAQGI